MKYRWSEEENWYDLLHQEVCKLADEDEDCLRHRRDSIERMERYLQLDLPLEVRRLIDDYMACALSLAERQIELAFGLGLEYMEKIIEDKKA